MFKKLRLFFQSVKAVRSGDLQHIDDFTRSAVADAMNGGQSQVTRLRPDVEDMLYAPSSDVLYPAEPQLTAQHVAMIRRIRLGWNGTESGAPECAPANSFVGGRAPDLIRDLLGDDVDDAAIAEFMISFLPALRAFMHSADLAAGTYTLSNMDADLYARSKRGLENAAALFAIAPDMTFTVTQDDITLAKATQWDWPDEDDMAVACERGDIAGPTVDPKRPYGDMTYIDLDIHRVLGWPVETRTESGHIGISDQQADEATRLHFRQLGTLQAFVEHAQLPPDPQYG